VETNPHLTNRFCEVVLGSTTIYKMVQSLSKIYCLCPRTRYQSLTSDKK